MPASMAAPTVAVAVAWSIAPLLSHPASESGRRGSDWHGCGGARGMADCGGCCGPGEVDADLVRYCMVCPRRALRASWGPHSTAFRSRLHYYYR